MKKAIERIRKLNELLRQNGDNRTVSVYVKEYPKKYDKRK